MKKNGWREPRLIPTTGIGSQVEQERRATAALLATMTAVERFGRALTEPLGAPEGTIETFVEVPFSTGDSECLPHGVIRVRETSQPESSWTALVEVSTGPRPLRSSRLEAYLDLATGHEIDALLTISNEIPPVAGQHPTPVAKEKLGQVSMLHFPWSKIVAEAVVEREECAEPDPVAARVLGELIHYLEHPRSGALLFEVAEDAPTTRLPRLEVAAPDPVAEVPIPRGPARREIRLALREDAEPSPPDQPGWYRDDQDTTRMRWWQGSAWTDHWYDLPPAPAGADEKLNTP
ncbi:DUF2510 domain-containing protein [Kineosporia sp. J2-2]|uniref:DUF2510 domain-containing protein n=1 Tax=Kineosporia corallincola TaxID=2835133 RepID=A0ABS5TSL1_9ACTN|nr:DUF2510 domain-containing protein [Kineosporia corallincola]MBT0773809.1 DUF2510 domain-containing protein [Kineosporia corallincola]